MCFVIVGQKRCVNVVGGGKIWCESPLCKEHLHELYLAIKPQLKVGIMWIIIEKL